MAANANANANTNTKEEEKVQRRSPPKPNHYQESKEEEELPPPSSPFVIILSSDDDDDDDESYDYNYNHHLDDFVEAVNDPPLVPLISTISRYYKEDNNININNGIDHDQHNMPMLLDLDGFHEDYNDLDLDLPMPFQFHVDDDHHHPVAVPVPAWPHQQPEPEPEPEPLLHMILPNNSQAAAAADSLPPGSIQYPSADDIEAMMVPTSFQIVDHDTNNNYNNYYYNANFDQAIINPYHHHWNATDYQGAPPAYGDAAMGSSDRNQEMNVGTEEVTESINTSVIIEISSSIKEFNDDDDDDDDDGPQVLKRSAGAPTPTPTCGILDDTNEVFPKKRPRLVETLGEDQVSPAKLIFLPIPKLNQPEIILLGSDITSRPYCNTYPSTDNATVENKGVLMLVPRPDDELGADLSAKTHNISALPLPQQELPISVATPNHNLWKEDFEELPFGDWETYLDFPSEASATAAASEEGEDRANAETKE